MKGFIFNFVFDYDSKSVGGLYFLFSFFSGVLGFSFSVVISIELSCPFYIIDEDYYYVSITIHGFIMLFYFLSLLASGFSNYLIPEMCFVFDMYFYSLNVYMVIGIFYSFVLVSGSLISGGVKAGWTLYVPLSMFEDIGSSMDWLIGGVHVFTMFSVFSSMNNMVTIWCICFDYESFFELSPFLWCYLVMSVLMLLASPSLTCVLTMLLLEKSFGVYFFNSDFGGDSVLFQTMFWWFGHPEVYILILPVFGMLSYVLYFLGGFNYYNKEGVVCSMISLGLLSFLVFGHHMTAVGWNLDVSNFFMTSTIAMSVPTGVKMFSWLYSLYFCNVSVFSLSSGFVILFIVYFSFGGMTGFFLSNSNLDFFLHDTWFVVGHLHVVLAISAFLGFNSGIWFLFFGEYNYNSFYLLFNYNMEFFLLFFVLFFVSSSLLFIPFHVVGLYGCPSSVSCYLLDVFFWFYIETIGGLGVWLSFLVFILGVCFLCSDDE